MNDIRLPRLGDDTPEDRPQRKWEELFYPRPAPERPEAFDLLLAEVDRHTAFMARSVEDSIPWEDAKRQMIRAKVKIDALVQVAVAAVADPAEEAAQDRQIERSRIDEEARRSAAMERARLRQEKAELEAAGREGLEDKAEEELERRADRLGAALAEEQKRHPKVVPLRPEGKDPNIPDAASRRPVLIDLISADELYSKHFDPLVFLVRDMLAAGTLNLLAGKPKIGKSFLALQVGRMVAAGEALWGHETTKVPVLYLGLEDSLRRLKYRLLGQLGAGVRPSGDLHFATLWPRVGVEGEDGIAAIEEVVERFGIRLVIIDTWQRFRAQAGGPRSGTAYTQDYDDLEPLLDLCRETGVAVLLIHHTKKGESASIFDMISGSVGLQGAVDCMMVLTGNPIKDLEGGSAAVLSGSARDFEGFEWELEFEKVPGTWKFVGKAAVVRAKGEQEAALETMRELGVPVSPSGLAREMGKTPAAAKMLLKRMLVGKLVARGEKAGTYVVPEPG